jgi:hypothetical protein
MVRTSLLKFTEKLQRNPETIVEIGVWEAENSKAMATQFPQAKLYLVDDYKKTTLATYGPVLPPEKVLPIIKKAESNMAGFNGRINFVRENSLTAATHFDDSSLDYVYIDGDHEEPAVAADIKAWYPKVKTGGMLAGHDVVANEVLNAFQKFCQENKLTTWAFCLGPYIGESDWWIFK